jgi:hypothetical protein
MAIFYTDTGSLGRLEVTGSTAMSGSSNVLNVRGSGSVILTVSGSTGGLLEVGDIGPSGDLFSVSSGSITIFDIDNTLNVTITGSLRVSGSIIGTAAINVSAGASSNNISNLVFSNSNGVSFGLNGNTITATVEGGGGGGGIDISAGASSANLGSVVFSNSNNVSFGLNGSTITATAGGQETLSYYNPNDGYIQVAAQIGQSSLQFQPAQFPDVQFDRVAIPINYSNATNSSGTVTVSMYFGVYTRNASTLSLLSNISTAQVVTNSGTVGSYTQLSGMRLMTIPFTGTFTEGQYYIGIGSRTAAAAGTATISNFVLSQINTNFLGIFGVGSAASVQYTRGLGVYSATFTSLPASVAFSQIQGTASQFLRRPAFYVVSQTF